MHYYIIKKPRKLVPLKRAFGLVILLKMAIEDKNILKGYAIDNKIGPLNSAKSNLNSHLE